MTRRPGLAGQDQRANDRRRVRRHVIRVITYRPGVPSGEAPIECECGWEGTGGQWMAHRGFDPAAHGRSREIDDDG